MPQRRPIPIIDLFAGPGGLGEGFAALRNKHNEPVFSLKVSIEKDRIAHETLSLRSIFRRLSQEGVVPECYYNHIRGEISRDDFLKHPDVAHISHEALSEAKCAELGRTPHEQIDEWITLGIDGSSDWVLIGGPPCQAYSLAGRSRRTNETQEKFESDEKHFLYREYLRIIKRFGPKVFIMENVKGMLSSQHGGSPIFDRIMSDLSNPGDGLSYEIRSLVVPSSSGTLTPKDFIIEAERFGIPQGRHRVVLFGVRRDEDSSSALLRNPYHFTLQPAHSQVSVGEVLSVLPRLRSKISRGKDDFKLWLETLKEAPSLLSGWNTEASELIAAIMKRATSNAHALDNTGASFIPTTLRKGTLTQPLSTWLQDPRIGGVIQHESRGHMRSDLHRYLFASAYAEQFGVSPKISNFPPKLLPNHGNVNAQNIPFSDRFRVQAKDSWSSTVVSHIAKDGHYFIHYDPAQCRSLTVREAARLQTFPDNYFFAGNRTEQYIQVGNAVPPLLAYQIAQVVFNFFESCDNYI